MVQPLPPLKALRAFEVAARQGSFARAAEELSVTPAAVSHQVKRLEEYLGVRLFRRLARGLALTAPGERMLPDVSGAFQRLGSAADAVRDSAAGRIVTVSIAPSLASRWLVPRIQDFREQYPGFELRVDARDQLVDLRRDDVDVALRYGPGGYEELHVEELPDQSVFPVCSPALLERGPLLETPADLCAHTLLHVEWRHTTRLVPDWRSWLDAVGAPQVDTETGPRFSQQSITLDAAVAGQGVALANEMLVAGDLEAGRLVRPLVESTPQEFRYFLVCLPEAVTTPRVRALREWVFSELSGA